MDTPQSPGTPDVTAAKEASAPVAPAKPAAQPKPAEHQPANHKREPMSRAAKGWLTLLALYVGAMLSIMFCNMYQHWADTITPHWKMGNLVAVIVLFVTTIVANHIRARNRRREAEAITIYSCPNFVYFWPVIALGYLFHWPFSSHLGLGSTTMAWIYVCAIITVALTVGFNLNRLASLLWLLVIGIIALGCVVVRLELGFTMLNRILSAIGHWFLTVSPEYSPRLGLVVSVLLTIPFCIMIIGIRLNDRCIISHNRFEHPRLLASDDNWGSGTKRVQATYHNIFAVLFLGAGTLTVYSAQGNRVLTEVKNVPGLFWMMDEIDRKLQAVEVSGSIGDEEGEHDGHDEDTAGDGHF